MSVGKARIGETWGLEGPKNYKIDVIKREELGKERRDSAQRGEFAPASTRMPEF
jgi:hypothetical protein